MRVSEFGLRVRRDPNTDRDELEGELDHHETLLNDLGSFLAGDLWPGAYRLQFTFPDPRYYLRSIVRTGAEGKTVDVGRTGLTVGPGDKIEGLTVTMADGAAGLKGRIVRRRKDARLPERSLFYLVPAEPDAANDVLRYFEAEVNVDGSVNLGNIAPGKYWVLVERLPVADPRVDFLRPAAWDATARLQLRRAAEAANVRLELKPGQRLTDRVFHFTTTTTTGK